MELGLWEAARTRLAVPLCCVLYWPQISTSCSPLIIRRSCFLSPQYLGCLPASPPTGKIHKLQNSQACFWSMGFAVITGLAVQSYCLWLLPLCLGTWFLIVLARRAMFMKPDPTSPSCQPECPYLPSGLDQNKQTVPHRSILTIVRGCLVYGVEDSEGLTQHYLGRVI